MYQTIQVKFQYPRASTANQLQLLRKVLFYKAMYSLFPYR